MSRIRMAVEIHNESSSTLVWDHDEVTSGDWTPGWVPSRVASVPPGGIAEWRCEGDLFIAPTTGTEARAWYNVDGDSSRQLYVHVDSPLVESQYGNTFHVWAPPGFEAAHNGGQGHEARLTIRFRDTALRSVPGFTPSVNGLPFANSGWDPNLPVMTAGFLWNRLLGQMGSDVTSALGLGPVDDNWLPFTHADAGLCGGMVFAVMDYFGVGRLPPTTGQPSLVDDPMYVFLRDRLFASFDILGSGHRWLGYSSPHYPDGDEGVFQTLGLTRGRTWVTYREEWPRIRDDIDGGRLSPLGLIKTKSLDIGENHQILGWAYTQSGQVVQLHVWDPNDPHKDDLALEFDVTDTTGAVSVTQVGYPPDPKPIFAVMRTDGYVTHGPPGSRAMTVRQALTRKLGHGDARLPADIGLGRPGSLKEWLSHA